MKDPTPEVSFAQLVFAFLFVLLILLITGVHDPLAIQPSPVHPGSPYPSPPPSPLVGPERSAAVKELRKQSGVPNFSDQLEGAEQAEAAKKREELFDALRRATQETQLRSPKGIEKLAKLQSQKTPVNLRGPRTPAWELYYESGLRHEEEGLSKEAIVDYEHALMLNPEYPEAHDRLGIILSRTEQFDDSVAHLKKAVALRPGVASFHRDLGQALNMAGRSDEAQREFAEAGPLDHQ